MSKMKKLISFVMILVIVAATAVVPSVPASAEQTDIWQVNGKYTLTKKKLVTYCALYSADSGMKKKKRTFKITSATKFIHVTPSYNKKKIKKSQIGKYIKKIKKSSYFQFKFKKGKVTEIHYCED